MDFSSLALPAAADLYPHVCTRYRHTEAFAADGKPLAGTWASVTAIPCYFQTGRSVFGTNSGLYAEADNSEVLDTIHFASGTDVRVGDLLKQTTGPDSGEYYVVRGNPQRRSQIARKLIVMAAKLEIAPDGVS